MSKDDDVPKKLQNDFLHQMYEDFGTIEEDCFYDRLEDGKYDGGFKEKQVKAESLDDAINKAMDMYYAEQIVLGAEDMKGVDFAPISEGQLPSSLKENGGRAR